MWGNLRPLGDCEEIICISRYHGNVLSSWHVLLLSNTGIQPSLKGIFAPKSWSSPWFIQQAGASPLKNHPVMVRFQAIVRQYEQTVSII